MHRSFAECMGVTWPKDVAMVVNGEPVTWAEVHAERRKKQAMILERKRRPEEPEVVPAYVWTFFNTSWIYHGW